MMNLILQSEYIAFQLAVDQGKTQHHHAPDIHCLATTLTTHALVVRDHPIQRPKLDDPEVLHGVRMLAMTIDIPMATY